MKTLLLSIMLFIPGCVTFSVSYTDRVGSSLSASFSGYAK